MLQIIDNLLEGEEPDIRDELKKLVQDPYKWLDTPNDQLGGRPPRDFLGSPEHEKPLRDLLRSIKHGMPT